jgi:hypothetical protein
MERSKDVARWVVITLGITLSLAWALAVGQGLLRLIAPAG